MEKFVAFIKKYKERVVLLAVLLSFVFFIGGGILLQDFNQQRRKSASKGLPKKVVLQVASAGKETKKEKGSATASAGAIFFLQPTAQDLIERLQDMQNLKPRVAQKRLQALRVLWPVFFFESRNEEGKSVAYFDIAEDGFGVVVQTEFSPEKYPELDGIERGKRLWLGGEIAAVDLAGTGRIELVLEYISFSSEVPGLTVPLKE